MLSHLGTFIFFAQPLRDLHFLIKISTVVFGDVVVVVVVVAVAVVVVVVVVVDNTLLPLSK